MSRDALLALTAAWLERPGAAERARGALRDAGAEKTAAAAGQQGLACVALEACARLDLPEEILAPVRAAARAGAARALALEPALDELGDCSRRRGLRAALVKGPALDRGAYPHPGLRPASDLDVIVRGADLPAWGELLEALGYEKFPHVDRTWRREDGATVDLHASSPDLVGVIDVPEELSPVRLDVAGLLDRAAEVEGLALPVPAAEDHLVICAAHGLGVHAFEKLVWLLDVVVLLAGCDHQRAAEAARSTGADRLLFHSLELAAALGLLQAPAGLTNQLRPRRQGRLERKLLARLARAPLPDRAEFLLALAMPAPRGYKRTLLRRAILPSGRTVSPEGRGVGRGIAGHVGRALRLVWLAITA
jgi:hypothetical protein